MTAIGITTNRFKHNLVFDTKSILDKVTDNLDIINCNDLEQSFIESILSDFLDTLSDKELIRLFY